MKNRIVLIAGMLMVAVGANAALVDDFNSTPLGADWSASAGPALWAIDSNKLKATSPAGDPTPSYIVNSSAAAQSSTANDFTVSAIENSSEAADFTGLVWNWQDDNNYQFFRFRWGNGQQLLQAGQKVGGTTSVSFEGNSGNGALSLFTSQQVLFSISYDATASQYTAETVLDSGVGSVRNSFTFSDSVFAGTPSSGDSGVYSMYATVGNTYDDFSVVPEPASMGLIGLVGVGFLVIRKTIMM